MTASQRLELIKRLSQRLESESWTDLDLTLRQFGLPWSANWDGVDRYAYCVHHIEQGDDAALTALDRHLFGSPDSETAPAPPPSDLPWTPNRFRLFLSHISAEKIFLSLIKAELASKGIEGFVAHEDIEPTKKWLEQIELALETCDALAAVMTPGFHESKWTDQEVGFCVNRRVLIIPVRMGIDPYGFISRYQALTCAERDPATISNGLFEILCKHDLTAEKMATALVSLFSNSESFADAKTNAKLLDKVKNWTPEMLREIEQALDKNRQTRDSWGVPEMVRAIVKRHGK